MPFNLLPQVELERRLLNWISKANVPRYPFFDGIPSSSAAQATLNPSLASSSTSAALPLSLSSSLQASNSNVLSLSSSGITGSSLEASTQELNHWLEFIEDASVECGIQEKQYPDAAVWFMRGELKEVMRERREVYLREARHVAGESRKKATTKTSDWEDFKKDLKRVVEEAGRIFRSATSQTRTSSSSLFIPASAYSSLPATTFAYIRRTHPYIASSLTLGLVVGGAVVLLPAISLGAEAWNRMREGANRAGGQVACPN